MTSFLCFSLNKINQVREYCRIGMRIYTIRMYTMDPLSLKDRWKVGITLDRFHTSEVKDSFNTQTTVHWVFFFNRRLRFSNIEKV